MASAYRVAAQISSETIDGEVMMIDLGSGNYFNLGGGGVPVWELLQAGVGREEIIAAMTRRFEGPPEGIAKAVGDLLDTLAGERLIEAAAAAQPPPFAAPEAPRAAFQEPVFRKFTDMRELLLVDPIHDVDEGGWPRIKS